MTDRSTSAAPVHAVLDLLVRRNPLLAHGPRTHGTGIEVQRASATAAPRRARRDVDAPRLHLGPERLLAR